MAVREHSIDGAVRAPKARYQHIQGGRPKEDVRRDRVGLPAPEDHGQETLVYAQAQIEAGNYPVAWAVIDRALAKNPDDALALNLWAQIAERERNVTQAYQFAKRAADIAPDRAQAWLTLANICEQLYRYDEGLGCIQRGLMVAQNDPQRATLNLNASSIAASMGDWARSEGLAREAARLNPNSRKAKANLGIALLGQRKWAEGWTNYNAGLGIKNHLERVRIDYGAKDWRGEKGRVVLYSEQGLGDEISFASMIPDVLGKAEIVIDCDHRLKGLFKRSFGCEVHGTRWAKERPWVKGIDYQSSFAELGEMVRQKDEDFPRKPYLVPDPDRVTMWQALFAKETKPVIGIAWSGGLPATGEQYRRLTLEQMLPIFQTKDAVWVSLQYKDASQEIAAFKAKYPDVDIRQYPYATLTKDYDDTAALVASLDCVLSMQTAVIHLAGALGKRTLCLVHKYGQWRYGTENKMIWYPDVSLLRQRQDGSWPIREAACWLV